MTTPQGPGRYIRPKQLDKRATWSRNIAWFLESVGWDALYWAPMKAMPIDMASNAGAAILGALGPLSSAHRTMIRNLRLAFPDWGRDRIDATAAGAWETLGRTAGEMPHLSRMRPYLPDSRITVVNGEALDEVRESGRPAVFISGHFANWEVMASAICNRPVNCQITYRAANNPRIDRRINAARHAYGIDVLTPKGAGTRELMRALSSGQSIALMNDQKFNQGIAAPFFGHDAMTAPGPSRLALRYGAPLVPMSTRRTGVARYTVEVHPPIWPDTTIPEDQAIERCVVQINRFIEERIRAAPEQWFWMHNRWSKETWQAAGVM